MQSDICVIGGGPAGLTSAIAFRLAGYSVSLFDTNTPPIDKACGEGLMPDTLETFRELGVRIPPGEGFPFRGVRFVRGSLTAQADFSPAFPQRHALGLRRTVLHRILTQRAQALGVDLHWGVNGEHPLSFQGSKLTIGADGQNSRVRKTAGLDCAARFTRFGFRRHYALEPWSSYVEVYWAARCQIYVTPISPHEIGVALLTGDRHQRLSDALPLFPQLAGRLSAARPTSREMGCLTATRTLEQVCGDRLALVGDASGSVDAITGEGVGLAARQAVALAQAFRAGRLADFAAAHRAICRRPRAMAALLLALSNHPAWQRPAITCLAAFPALFDRLLSMHVALRGESPPPGPSAMPVAPV